METLLMKGKPVADAYKEVVAAKIAAAKERGIKVVLAIIIVGDDPASHVYKDRLVKLLESLGGASKVLQLPTASTQEEVIAVVQKLNLNSYVTGILPMMPMPKHIDGDAVGAMISADKDVDCLNPQNMGEVLLGRGNRASCTPRACLATLKHYGIELQGKNVVVVGRSNVVGKPVALLLMQENATVTICHSRTQDIGAVLRNADLIVAAVGIPGFVKPEMVKAGAVIVDVGINATEKGLVGDVAPEVAFKAGAFTPVPGGIGVVSNMMVMDMLSRNL